MKGAPRPVAILATAVALSLPQLSAAQASARPVAVGIALGPTIPIGDFANDSKTGFHGTGFLQYEPAAGIWGVRGEFAYHRSDLTDEALGAAGGTADDKVTTGITHLGATALLIGNKRSRSVTPYLLGGLGFYRVAVSANSGSISLSTSENGFGFNGGAGLRFGKSAGFFAELRFHQFSITPDGAEKSTYQMIPVTVGVRF